MSLTVSHISKSFGENVVISDAVFNIADKEKAAIVGINGAGKTTLLNIITGKDEPDSGFVSISSGCRIGYLTQKQTPDTHNTLYDEVYNANQKLIKAKSRLEKLEALIGSLGQNATQSILSEYSELMAYYESENGYAYAGEVSGVLKGLGFSTDDYGKKLSSLSGGMKTRAALAKLLLQKPDLLILDEPTNHLDISSVKWLENFLSSYKGAVLLVAHDRYFLDRIAEKIIELENGRTTVYSGNYSDYSVKKELLRQAAYKEYLKDAAFIKHQKAVIEKLHSFNREKSVRRARSREKLLERHTAAARPVSTDDKMRLTFDNYSGRSGNDVLKVSGLSKAFGENVLFSDVNLLIGRGEKVAFIGDNGCGKTTFLKIINGIIPASSGSITPGVNVIIGYYDQEQQQLHDEKTIFDEIHDAYPLLDNTKIRSTLALFMFTGDDVFKQVCALSGGERGRLSLAKLILSPCNLLILDEPTNHLDITSKEILENALLDYEGTLIFVSHDRYFISKLADRVIEIENKTFMDYKGDYEYYLEKKTESVSSPVSEKNSSSVQKELRQQKKAAAANEKRIENEKKAVQEKIASMEARQQEIEALLTQEEIYTNIQKCMELNEELEEIKSGIESLFERWEQLEQ